MRFSEWCHDLGVGGELECELPAVLEDPTDTIIIVIWVERTEHPEEEPLVAVTPLVVLALKDLGADGRSSSGNTEHSTVDIRLRSNTEVVSLQVQTSDKVRERGVYTIAGPLGDVADNLFPSADKTNLGVVKSGHQGLQEVGLPVDVVVDANGDRRILLVDLLGCGNNLPTLVRRLGPGYDECSLGEEGLEAINFATDVTLQFDTHGDDDHHAGDVCQDAVTTLHEGRSVWRNSRDDNRDVTIVVLWMVRASGTVEDQAGESVDQESVVAEQEQGEEEKVGNGKTNSSRKQGHKANQKDGPRKEGHCVLPCPGDW